MRIKSDRELQLLHMRIFCKEEVLMFAKKYAEARLKAVSTGESTSVDIAYDHLVSCLDNFLDGYDELNDPSS